MTQSPNRILNAPPQNIFAAVEPHLRHVDLPFGMVVAETEREVDRVYFPSTGVVSLVVEMTVGDMIETAMVGRDGVVNGTSALDGKSRAAKGPCSGCRHTQCAPDTLQNLADEFRPLRSILIRGKICSRRRSSRPVVTRAIWLRNACADGCCVFAI